MWDHGKVTGNIKGYEEPVVVEFYTPIRVTPTSHYLDRKSKFTKWLGLSGNNLSEPINAILRPAG